MKALKQQFEDGNRAAAELIRSALVKYEESLPSQLGRCSVVVA